MNSEIISLNNNICDTESKEIQAEASGYELTKRQKQLIQISDDIGRHTPLEANELGFGAKCLVAACLPYRNPKPEKLQNGCWVRTNGDYTLFVQGSNLGIPYGSYPRLFTIWLTTVATKTQSRRIVLAKSFKKFCEMLQIDYSLGKRGSGRILVEQIHKFLSARVGFINSKSNMTQTVFMNFSDGYSLFWDEDRHNPGTSLKEAEIVLSEAFYNEITSHHIPIDLRTVLALKQSAQALDIYQFLAYRMYSLNHSNKKVAYISWEQLDKQFGASYSNIKHFKADFIRSLNMVKAIYTEAKVEPQAHGLMLKASPTPVQTLVIPDFGK